MRLPVQVEGIIYRKNAAKIEYLLLRRAQKEGGFWQSITGGLEDGETLKNGLLREIREETGIKNPKITKLIFSFQFFGEYLSQKMWLTEFVYGAKVKNQKIKLCAREHDKYEWLTYKDALKKLKWPNNKKALIKLNKAIN